MPLAESIKEIVASHQNVPIKAGLVVSYEHEDGDESMREDLKAKATTEDTKDDSSEIEMTEHEFKSDHLGTRPKESMANTVFKTQVLEDLKQFLLEKDIWDGVFCKRRVSRTGKDSSKESPVVRQDEYLEEDMYFTSQWVDSFMAKLMKLSSKVIQETLTHFSEEIRLRDVAMSLYWQLMASKSNKKSFPDFDKNVKNLEFEGIQEKSRPTIESSDINEKLLSYEKIGIVRQHVEDIKKQMKRIDSIHNSKGRNIARKDLLGKLIDAIRVCQGKLYEEASQIAKYSNVKYVSIENRNKIEQLLDHDGTIYNYSEFDEVIPHLWIGDYSVLKTPCKLRNIHYRIILGDCKKCITDQYDNCNARHHPFNYTPPYYMVNGNIHCMGIQAIDDASFPIFQYFRSACDYIDKSLSASPKKNVAVISKLGQSRCTAIVIAYLMIKKNYTLKNAVQELKKKRAIGTNLGFMVQLIQLERKLRARSNVRPDVKVKNLFPIRRKNLLDSYWLREKETVSKSTKSFVFLDDRMSRPDRRPGVNTNLLLHSPFSAPGPHFYKDIETSIVRTSMLEMLPFYELDIASTKCDYKYPVVEGRVLASFSC